MEKKGRKSGGLSVGTIHAYGALRVDDFPATGRESETEAASIMTIRIDFA